MSKFPNVDQTVAQNYEAGGWASEAEATFALNAVVADTGQLAAGIYDFYVLLYIPNIAAYTLLQHRNAANDASLKEQTLGGHSEVTVEWSFLGYKMAVNERLRMIAKIGWTGTGKGSIFWVKRV